MKEINMKHRSFFIAPLLTVLAVAMLLVAQSGVIDNPVTGPAKASAAFYTDSAVDSCVIGDKSTTCTYKDGTKEICKNVGEDNETCTINGKTEKKKDRSRVEANRQQILDYEICPALKKIDTDDATAKAAANCKSYTYQADLDTAAKKICDKYSDDKLKTECSNYKNNVKYVAPASTGSGNGDANVSCEKGGAPLDWILCPIFNGVSDSSDWLLKNIIQPELRTDAICLSPDGKNCEDSTNAVYTVWSSFRIYGNIFLVIALLFIVFGQAIGGGIVDAYTAKKVLPRLLAAAILINLSIYIVAALVDITNVIGTSIGQVMTAPLQGKGAFEIHPSGIQQAAVVGGAGAAGLLGIGSLLALPSFAGISFIFVALVIPAALAVIAIFVTIALRKAVIIALIIVSPVAFALYCLPNTEKYFKKWWDLLSQMLLIYPIITVIFAVSSIMSVITGGTNSGNMLNAMLSFMFLIIPLFLIPYSFKLAGNALGQLHGAVTGGAARLGKMNESRRDKAKAGFQRKALSKTSGIYNSKPMQGVANSRLANKGRFNPVGYGLQRKSGALQQQVAIAGADLGKDPRAQAIQHDDSTLRAATYGGYSEAVTGLRQHFQKDVDAGKMTDTEAKAEAQRGARAVQSSVGFGNAQAMWAAQAMSATGTAYSDVEDVAATIARASGGNQSMISSLAGNINSSTKQAGRHDLAPGFASLDRLAKHESQVQRKIVTPGATVTQSDGSVISREQAYDKAQESAWESGSLYQHANDKPQNIEAAISHYSKKLSSSDSNEREKAVVFYDELKAMAPSASGAVKAKIDGAFAADGNTVQRVRDRLDDTPQSPGTDRAVMGQRQAHDDAGNLLFHPQQKDANGNPAPIMVREKVGSRPETGSERVDRRSRTYERPDPNTQ